MKEDKTSSKKIFFWLLLLVFLWLAITRFAKTTEILEVLSHGKWYWIILALICQIFYYPLSALYIKKILSIFEANFQYRKILSIVIASKFTDVALPLSTVGKIALFIRNGKKLGQSALNTGLGIFFALFLEISAFACLSIIGSAILYFFGTPQLFVLVTLMILTLLVLLVSLFLYRLVIYQNRLHPTLFVLAKLFLHLIGRGEITKTETDTILIETGKDLGANRKKIMPALWYIVIAHLINLITMAFIFLAFAGQVDPLAILACYIAGQLFSTVSITPQGIGVAETVMIATLCSFGLDISTAAVITLAYRGLLYWLPIFFGFFVFSRLELKTKELE